MSFWVKQNYYTKIDTTMRYCEIFGGSGGHDTFEEAEAYRDAFNSDPDHPHRSANDPFEYCHGPYRTYPENSALYEGDPPCPHFSFTIYFLS